MCCWYLSFCQKGKRRWGASPPFLIHFSSHWNPPPTTHPICSPFSFLSPFFFLILLQTKVKKYFNPTLPFISFSSIYPWIFSSSFFISIFSVSVPLLADVPLVVLWPCCLSQPSLRCPSQISAELMSREGGGATAREHETVSSLASGVDIPGHETRFQSLFVAIHVISWGVGKGGLVTCVWMTHDVGWSGSFCVLSKLAFGIRSTLNFS